MILFFDTETTGLPDFNKTPKHESQPHIVQLAAILTDDSGDVLESHNVIVKPDGWIIPKEASDIHGITHNVASAIGISELTASSLLLEMIKKSNLLVAHDLAFDKFLLRTAMLRHKLLADAEDSCRRELKCFCTMQATTEICKLPGKYGYKWPNLQEAYFHAFKKEFDGAHDALADVNACKEIYFWLQEREMKKENRDSDH